MDVTAEDFRRYYESLSDEALLEIDTGELVRVAQDCHAEEVARRGLVEEVAGEATDASASEPAESAAVAPDDELVCIVEYDFHDEADLARGLLEAAEIPASLEAEPGIAAGPVSRYLPTAPGVVRLMVPRALAEQALSMLAAPLSDEELAAQAEAAGLEDESED